MAKTGQRSPGKRACPHWLRAVGRGPRTQGTGALMGQRQGHTLPLPPAPDPTRTPSPGTMRDGKEQSLGGKAKNHPARAGGTQSGHSDIF